MRIPTLLLWALLGVGCGQEVASEWERSGVMRAALSPEESPCVVEDILSPLEYGFWPAGEERPFTPFYAYLDVAIHNPDPTGRVTAFLRVGRENGTREQTLYHLHYKGTLGDRRERWGTAGITLYAHVPPHGEIISLEVSFSVANGSAKTTPPYECYSTHSYSLNLKPFLEDPGRALTQLRAFPRGDYEPGHRGVQYDVHLARRPFTDDSLPEIEALFAPYDNPERTLIAEINRVIEAQEQSPGTRHTIDASFFDLNDPRIVDRLIYAHQVGVVVRLLTDAAHLAPTRHWQTEYKRLQLAGVSVLGVVREGFAASNHTKFAVFDGQVVTTGSLNWDYRAIEHNSESLIVIRSPKAAAIYQEMLRGIAGGSLMERPIPLEDPLRIYYSQQHRIPAVLAREIDKAKTSLDVAMFTLRHLEFWEGGRRDDVLLHLVAAHRRGVRVRVLLEENIADAGEYYGRITPDDPTDEWLAAHGIPVTTIRTFFGGDRYAAMHHKFAVIDERITLVGAYNWYEPSERPDDDLVIIDDPEVAARFGGEFTHLNYRYGSFGAEDFRTTRLDIELHDPFTSWGDTIHVVGDVPALGQWDPRGALALTGAEWPLWKVSLELPAGLHFEYKFLIQNSNGVYWEAGLNRSHTVSPLLERETLVASPRPFSG